MIAIQAAVRAGVGIATLLPGNVEAGIVVLDPRACRLPAPPRVESRALPPPGFTEAAETQRKLEICAAIFANLWFKKHAITQP